MSGKASISVFCDCCCGDMGRGGFGGGISVASSVKRTPGLGDFEGAGGAMAESWADAVGASLSSSKSSSRAVVGLSGGCSCQYEKLGIAGDATFSAVGFSAMLVVWCTVLCYVEVAWCRASTLAV
jgi:hypothetical protein